MPKAEFESTHEVDELTVVAEFKGAPEEIERQWHESVYRDHGDRMPQLTLRTVVMGSCLGAILSLTNLYIGHKAERALASQLWPASCRMRSGRAC